jgi:Protein of unknown function (DUF664)
MSTELLVDAFERIRDAVHPAVNGLSGEDLAFRPDPQSNSIAWLVWHLTRIQDTSVAGLDDRPEVWSTAGWLARFGLPLEASDTGFGHDPETVGKVRADAGALLGYFEDVHAATIEVVRPMSDAALARVVDDTWEPPVTVASRLLTVIVDDLQHVGQAAYVRGILARRAG